MINTLNFTESKRLKVCKICEIKSGERCITLRCYVSPDKVSLFFHTKCLFNAVAALGGRDV